MEKNYGLFIRFPDQSESFTLGYEAGLVGAKMERGDPFEMLMHSKNEELIRDMANKYGYIPHIKSHPDYEEWKELTAIPNP